MSDVETLVQEHKPTPNPGRFVIQAVLSMRAGLQKILDTITPPELQIFEHVFAVMRTQMVYVAAKLRLADLLDKGPMSAAELAERTGANADALDRMLKALASIGVFERTADGNWQNNRTSKTLRTGQPGGPTFAEYFGSPYHAHAWAEFEHTVMTGESAFEKFHGKTFWQHCAENPRDGKMFAESMASATDLEAPSVATDYPWNQIERVCDVAGGSGTLIAEVLSQNPRLEAILFDEPYVLEEARIRLRQRKVLDRCELLSGSFFESVPGDCDAYILKDILHDWDDARSLSILKTVRRAMPKRARLLVIEMVMIDDPKYPIVNLSDMQMMTVCSGGRQRSEKEFASLFKKADLRLNRVMPLPGFASIVEAFPT